MQLILSPRNTEDGQKLARAAESRRWQVHTLTSWRLPAELMSQPDLTIYGEPLFCRIIAAQCQRVLLEPPHDWLCRLPRAHTHRAIQMVRFDEIADLSYPRFLKPPDDKIFGAAVYQSTAELAAREDIAPDQAVIASDPADFAKEYRVYLLNHRAVACSLYCVQGKFVDQAEDPDLARAAAFAETVALARPEATPPALVVDVGILADGQWAVVEANPVFGAGIYQADPEKVLDVLKAACLHLDRLPKNLAAFTQPVQLD